MKKLTLLFCLLAFTITAQTTQWDYIKQIKPTEWVVQKPIQHDVTINNPNKLPNSVIGGVIGHIVFGGFTGALLGGAAGYGMSDDTKTITETEYIPVTIQGYIVVTESGIIFRTTKKYTLYQVINLNRIKKE